MAPVVCIGARYVLQNKLRSLYRTNHQHSYIFYALRQRKKQLNVVAIFLTFSNSIVTFFIPVQIWYKKLSQLANISNQTVSFSKCIVMTMHHARNLATFNINSNSTKGITTDHESDMGKGWPVDGLPFPDTGCPVPDVSIYYMSNINELPDGILFHWFCKCTPPWMFLPLDIPSEYRPEHVTFGLPCVIFKFPSRIFCRRVPGFATDCPCGVWCRGLTTCLLYVGPPLEF